MDLSINPNSLDVQHPKGIDTKKFGDGAFCSSMANAGTDADEDVALRCRALTLLYGKGNSRDFAAKIGASPTRWNNIEGSGALSKHVARLIVRKYPEISLDWVWLGSDRGLTKNQSDELLDAYHKVRAEIVPAPQRRRAG